MKLAIVSVFWVVFLIQTAEGRKCYECVYMEPADKLPDEIKNEKTCKNGMKPSSEVLKTCPDTSLGCGKVVATLKMLNQETNAKLTVDMTVRGCMEPSLVYTSNISTKETKLCASSSVEEFLHLIADEIQRERAEEYFEEKGVDKTSEGTMCFCTDDKCNGANSNFSVKYIPLIFILTKIFF